MFIIGIIFQDTKDKRNKGWLALRGMWGKRSVPVEEDVEVHKIQGHTQG